MVSGGPIKPTYLSKRRGQRYLWPRRHAEVGKPMWYSETQLEPKALPPYQCNPGILRTPSALSFLGNKRLYTALRPLLQSLHIIYITCISHIINHQLYNYRHNSGTLASFQHNTGILTSFQQNSGILTSFQQNSGIFTSFQHNSGIFTSFQQNSGILPLFNKTWAYLPLFLIFTLGKFDLSSWW